MQRSIMCWAIIFSWQAWPDTEKAARKIAFLHITSIKNLYFVPYFSNSSQPLPIKSTGNCGKSFDELRRDLLG